MVLPSAGQGIWVKSLRFFCQILCFLLRQLGECAVRRSETPTPMWKGRFVSTKRGFRKRGRAFWSNGAFFVSLFGVFGKLTIFRVFWENGVAPPPARVFVKLCLVLVNFCGAGRGTGRTIRGPRVFVKMSWCPFGTAADFCPIVSFFCGKISWAL